LLRTACCAWRCAWQLAALDEPAHADNVSCGDTQKEDYPVADDHDRGESDRDNNPWGRA